MKRLIALRKRYKAFGRGSFEFLHPANRRVLAFVRRYQEESVLVVANLSRLVQHVELDLSGFGGFTPTEMLGHTALPPVDPQRPYSLTLGPHAFYWFSLEPRVADRKASVPGPPAAPTLVIGEDWPEVLHNAVRRRLEAALPAFLASRSWFPAADRAIKSVAIREGFRIRHGEAIAVIALLEIAYEVGAEDTYLLPLTFATGRRPRRCCSARRRRS